MPIKLTTTIAGKKRKKKNKIQKNLQNKSKHKKNKCFSWVSAVRVLSLAGSHSPPRLLGCPLTLSWSLALLWGSSDSNLALLLCLLLQCPQPSEPARLLSRARSVAAHLLHRHGVCLVGPVGYYAAGAAGWKVLGLLPSHTAPGFQLWFYLHICMWVIHWGLLLRLPWRTWVCPCEGQGWRWCSCLGCRGSGSTRYSGGLAARGAGNTVL